MKRRMDRDLYEKLGITAKKRENDWAILVDGQPAMIGLSEKDLERIQQMPANEVIKILSMT